MSSKMGKTKKGLLAGGKISRRHSSLISPAQKIVSAAKRMAAVKKVSLGIIKVTACTPGIKIVESSPGILCLRVRGAASIQTIWIYLQSPEQSLPVQAALKNAFDS